MSETLDFKTIRSDCKKLEKRGPKGTAVSERSAVKNRFPVSVSECAARRGVSHARESWQLSPSSSVKTGPHPPRRRRSDFDASSSPQGHNWIIVYSRPVYFCLCCTMIWVFDLSGRAGSLQPVSLYGVTFFSADFLLCVRDMLIGQSAHTVDNVCIGFTAANLICFLWPRSVCLVFPSYFPLRVATSGQYFCDVSAGADRHAHIRWNR